MEQSKKTQVKLEKEKNVLNNETKNDFSSQKMQSQKSIDDEKLFQVIFTFNLLSILNNCLKSSTHLWASFTIYYTKIIPV